MALPEQPWYLENTQSENEVKILKLVKDRPTAPVIYSRTMGYLEVPAVVVSYLSEPGVIGPGGAGFLAVSTTDPSLRERAISALVEKRLIANAKAFDAGQLGILWAGTAKEAVDRIKNT